MERYRIEIESELDGDWSSWLGNLDMTHTANGRTVLTGNVVDQTALHGLLARIRDLGIPILLVARMTPLESIHCMNMEEDNDNKY